MEEEFGDTMTVKNFGSSFEIYRDIGEPESETKQFIKTASYSLVDFAESIYTLDWMHPELISKLNPNAVRFYRITFNDDGVGRVEPEPSYKPMK